MKTFLLTLIGFTVEQCRVGGRILATRAIFTHLDAQVSSLRFTDSIIYPTPEPENNLESRGFV